MGDLGSRTINDNDSSCLKNLDSIVRKISDLVDDGVVGEKKSSTIQNLFDELLESLKNINLISQNYVSKTFMELDKQALDFLKGINIKDDEHALDSFKHLTKMIQLLKSVDDYTKYIDGKINQHLVLRHQLHRTLLIEKSIIKYAAETILRADHFILSFFKCDWSKHFFKFLCNDLFGWLKEFNQSFEPNYLLVLGSVNSRVLAQFLYKSDNFFNNSILIQNIEQEYYESLDPSLGCFLRLILQKMIAAEQNVQQFVSHLDTNSSDKMTLTKTKNQPNNATHFFSTIGHANRSLNILLFSVDYIVLSMYVKSLLLDEYTTELASFHKYINEQQVESLTSIVYTRWLLWACILFGRCEGFDWGNCCINLDKIKYYDVVNGIRNQLTFNTSLHASNVADGVQIELVQATNTVRTVIDQNKLSEYHKMPEKFPSLEELVSMEMGETNLTAHVPTFYDYKHLDKFKRLETKFVLLNKLGGALGTSQLYNFNANELCFNLINVDKKTLHIIFV